MPGMGQELNYVEEVLASVARTATTTSARQHNYCASGLALLIDVTAVAAPAPNVSAAEIQALIGTDAALDASWKTIYTFSALGIATATTFALLLFPGAASAGNWTVAPQQGVLPRHWRLKLTHDNANSITYRVQASYVPA